MGHGARHRPVADRERDASGHAGGIAAGGDCDGQVLVSTDLIGLLPDPPPFVAPRANVRDIIRGAAAEFAAEVRATAAQPAARSAAHKP